MPFLSKLELAGSPFEQASWAPRTFYWNPAADVETGETVNFPTASVFAYDPANPADVVDVSDDVLGPNSPQMGSGTHAAEIQVVLKAALTPGREYRVQLTAFGNLGTTPARFFRVRCLV